MDIEKKLRRVEQELAYVRAEYEEYCSAISHDFAGPLRAMGGFSEIILSNNEAVFDEKTKRHFDIILNSAKDGKMMLDVTRQFSHLPRSNAPFKDFGCEALVASVLLPLIELTGKSDAKVNVEKLPRITGDKEQIRLVFYHLLKNALTYCHPTEVTLINVSALDHDEFVEFQISDNGIGVPKKMDERIFQILKRAVSPKDYPGHGMGLAIAKKIVHRHGGEIQLLRDVSEQTVFSFTLSKAPIAL